MEHETNDRRQGKAVLFVPLEEDLPHIGENA